MVWESRDQKLSRDPFAVKPLPRSHYHPSKQKQLSSSQKKTALSPNRPVVKQSKDNEEKARSPSEEMFLKGSNWYSAKTPPPDDNASSKFDESWPSSERPSSVGVGEQDNNSPFSLEKMLTNYGKKSRLADIKQTLNFTDGDKPEEKNEETTLQRYIDRFRTGKPMSREERQKRSGADTRDFWWVDSEKNGDYHRDSKKQKDSNGTISRLTADKLRHLQNSPQDKLTDLLQEKADRILERGSNLSMSSVATSDPIVSTDGLGSSLEGTISSFEEQPYRPSFAKDFGSDPLSKKQRNTEPIPQPVFQRPTKPTRPEDDILYQWRIRRRLEAARGTADKGPCHNNTFGFLSKPQEETEIDDRLGMFKKKLSGRTETIDQSISPAYRSPERRNQEVSHSRGAVHFTPVPHLSTNDNKTAENQISDNQPSIASPTLHRKNTYQPVEPHHHLVCDLLPCQHTSQFSAPSQKDEASRNTISKKVGDEGSGYSSETMNQEDGKMSRKMSEENLLRGIDKGRNKEKLMDTSAEFDGVRYRYLEAERPDIEKPDNGSDRTMETDRLMREEKLSQLSSVQPQSEISEKTNSKKKHNNYQTEGEFSNNLQQVSDNGQDTRTRSEKKILKPKESGSPSMQRFQNVNNAIGQVIKDRLFTSSLSTVISSMDSTMVEPVQQSIEIESTRLSAPDVAHTVNESERLSEQHSENQHGILSDMKQNKQSENTQSKRTLREKPPLENQSGITPKGPKFISEEEGEYESDGEFPEDQLLQILRSQRSQYEKQLSQIDVLLSEFSSTT